ncbi:hypothetical protein DFH28DRAFT_882487, partial [Melampsora americana]
NCNKSLCSVKNTQPTLVERQISKAMDFEIVHVQTNQFVLTLAAFYLAQLHHDWALPPIYEITPREWTKAIKAGLHNWTTSIMEKDDVNEKKRKTEIMSTLCGTL